MQYDPSSQQYVPAQQYAGTASQPRFSALAIAAFVCSLLGFLGFTAILGIILGIAGIAATRANRKRGMGLAIAAIPISLVTGVLSVVLVFGVLMVSRYVQVPAKLRPALVAEDPAGPEAISAIREAAAPSFNDEVSDGQLAAWLRKVRETHGRVVDMKPDSVPTTTTPAGTTLNFEGKFVNGTAQVRLTLQPEGAWSMKFDDIDIGGLSPRDPEQPAPP